MNPARLAAVLAACLLGAACSNIQVAVNPRADFSVVKRVAVISFSGAEGGMAADVLTQYLVAYGADVVERSRLQSVLEEQHMGAAGILDPLTAKKIGKILGVDALIVGTVSDMTPSRSYVVQTSPTIFLGGVTPIEGRTVMSVGTVPGLPDTQIIASDASVGLVARMVDVETGSILWSAMMNYEGYDIPSAMRSITESFVASLVPVWPLLIKPK